MNRRELELLYKEINTSFFNKELPDVFIYSLNYVEQLGIMSLHGVEPFEGFTAITLQDDIFLGVDSSLNDLDTFNCMVHEMVHVWQFENGIRLGHCKKFNKKCDEAWEYYYN